MIPVLKLSVAGEAVRAKQLQAQLRLDARSLALGLGQRAEHAASAQAILADVAQRGDAAIVDISRKFDDPTFEASQIRVSTDAMADAAGRVPTDQLSAIRRSIAQVREYQSHLMPRPMPSLERPGVSLGVRYTPLDSAGLYFPGGKASYPSSLIMLAAPAQVAGVQKLVACTTPSRLGTSDLVLAAAHELGITDLFRCNGVAAIAAMAFGTETIPAVDKIVGPGHPVVQMAKRLLFGGVGIDGFLGASEIVVIADASANADFIASDLLAQAEHDPGSCFLVTPSTELANAVVNAIARQFANLSRQPAIAKALSERSAIIVTGSLPEAVAWANDFAAEHVNIQTTDDEGVLSHLKHAGAVFVGPYSPVAAGDYVAGPSHCLPTNTTARFASGISVMQFLKAMSVEKYTAEGLAADAPAIIAMAKAEQLDAHAASVRVRVEN